MSLEPDTMDFPPTPLPSFKDRQTGLLVFGIIDILLGLLCLLFLGLMLFGQAMIPQEANAGMPFRMLAPVLVIYLGLAVMFVWLGIGSIQCRRWARALMLIFSWCWLGTGIITVPLMAFILPGSMRAAMKQGAALPEGALMGIIIFQIIFMSVLLIALPALLVWFYRSPHVKATCEARNPLPSWTDACPLPLLGVSLMLWMGAVMMLGMPFTYGGVMPFFGTLLEGWSGTLYALSLAVLWIWLARLWYRAQFTGWWVLLVVMILFGLSSFITFQRVDFIEMYQKMGYPQHMIDQIRQQGMLTNDRMAWFSIAWLFPMLGYLFWVKRFFKVQP